MTDDDLTEPDHTYSVAGIDTPKGALGIVYMYVDNLKDPSRLPQYSDLAAEKILNPKVSPKYSLKLERR